jgi:hypothetical protein
MKFADELPAMILADQTAATKPPVSPAVKALKEKYFRLLEEEDLWSKNHVNGKRFPKLKELDELQKYVRELAGADALAEEVGPEILLG